MFDIAHKHLEVYKSALLLVKEVYLFTKNLPVDEKYGLSSQLRRAAISVCSNIAEGASRKSFPDRRRFYEIARSSVVEIDTQIEISILIQHVSAEDAACVELAIPPVFKMLSKMIISLSNRGNS